jgi:Leucine-rich repeat (LRR) protein
VLVKEIVETGLQIINVVDYAEQGYSSSSLFLYFAVIALNAVVWWMLTFPRTIRVVRGILVMNALISAFYGLFPLVYLSIDGVGGIMLGGNVAVEDLKSSFRSMMMVSATREALFGGSFIAVVRKIVFRLLPLFLSTSAIEDLTGLGFFLKGEDTKPSQVIAIDAMQKRDDSRSIITSDHAAAPPTTHKRMDSAARAADRLSRKLARSHNHRGLAKWKVMPAIVFVLTLVIAMCGRLASLNESCRYTHGSNSTSSGQLQPHWVRRWCLYQSYPLLSELPGSPSQCACALLYIRGDYKTQSGLKSSKARDPCDQGALTQLHDDITNDELHIAKYLQILIHNCPMQNATETGNILATNKLEKVTTIMLQSTRNGTDEGVKIQLRGLRTSDVSLTEKRDLLDKCISQFPPSHIHRSHSSLQYHSLSHLTSHLPPLPPLFSARSVISFSAERAPKGMGVPFSNPSEKSFERCTGLIFLQMEHVGWTNIPAGALRPLKQLAELHVNSNYLTQLPDLTANTALVYLRVHFNYLTQLPDLTANTALATLYAQNNYLTQLPDLTTNTALEYLRVDNNRLTHLPDLTANTALKNLFATTNRLTQIPELTTNTALESLYANNNRLSSWPRSLERLTRLKQLATQSNQLTNIPALVDRLPRLKYLDVSNNTITSLDTLAATAAAGGEAAAQSGSNETLLLLGHNPVCANGGISGGAVLRAGSKWFVSCQSQCSSTCTWSIPWEPAGVEDLRSNGRCDIGCNATTCSFDGGDCLGGLIVMASPLASCRDC